MWLAEKVKKMDDGEGKQVICVVEAVRGEKGVCGGRERRGTTKEGDS